MTTGDCSSPVAENKRLLGQLFLGSFEHWCIGNSTDIGSEAQRLKTSLADAMSDKGSDKFFGKTPTWDGEPTKFEEFQQKVKWHILGTKKSERSLVTARIAGSLTGKAWQILEYLPEERKEEIVAAESADALLEFLKESLMDSAVPEAGKWVREYLYKLRRNKGESMKLFTQRHSAPLNRLEKAMKMVEKGKISWRTLIEPMIQKKQSFISSEEDEAQGDKSDK